MSLDRLLEIGDHYSVDRDLIVSLDKRTIRLSDLKGNEDRKCNFVLTVITSDGIKTPCFFKEEKDRDEVYTNILSFRSELSLNCKRRIKEVIFWDDGFPQ